MTIQFSVCIPVWNDAVWLPGAIESVRNQDYEAWELIIGDNASDDDLQSIVLRNDDPRIRHHRFAKHTDIYENFNRTAQLAKNDWILMLSSDDRLTPDCLSELAQRIEAECDAEPPLVMVLTTCSRVDADGKAADRAFYGHSRINHIRDGTYGPSEWMEIMTNPGQLQWAFGSIAFSRSILTEIGWMHPEVGHGADLDLVLRTAAYGSVSYIDKPLELYTVRGDSDSAGRVQSNLSGGDPFTDYSAAWESALRAHTLKRGVTPRERSRVRAVMARSHIERSLQHRLWKGGRGRAGALGDVWRAFEFSPRLLLSPVHVGAAVVAVIAPRWIIGPLMSRFASSRRRELIKPPATAGVQ